MAFHLGAEDQFRLQRRDLRLDFEIIVGDQRLDLKVLRSRADFAGELSRISPQADDREAEFLGGDARGGDGVGGVAEDEDALAGQVGRVDRTGIPGQPGLVRLQQRRGIDASQFGHFGNEVAGGADADRHEFGRCLAEIARQPGCGLHARFGIQHDIEAGVAETGEVGRGGTERGNDVDGDAETAKQGGDFGDVVAMTKTKRGRAEDVAACPRRRLRWPDGEGADQLIKSFRGAPVFLFLVGRQLDRHNRDRQAQRFGQAARIVLDQFGGAGCADQQGLRLEPLVGLMRGVLEQFGGVAAEVARLEGRVGDRRALRLPLDHSEQQVGVGVALRRVQHVVQPLHRGGDPHRPDMGRSLIGPQREFHGVTPPAACGAPAGGRTVRRDRRPGRSPGLA